MRRRRRDRRIDRHDTRHLGRHARQRARRRVRGGVPRLLELLVRLRRQSVAKHIEDDVARRRRPAVLLGPREAADVRDVCVLSDAVHARYMRQDQVRLSRRIRVVVRRRVGEGLDRGDVLCLGLGERLGWDLDVERRRRCLGRERRLAAHGARLRLRGLRRRRRRAGALALAHSRGAHDGARLHRHRGLLLFEVLDGLPALLGAALGRLVGARERRARPRHVTLLQTLHELRLAAGRGQTALTKQGAQLGDLLRVVAFVREEHGRDERARRRRRAPAERTQTRRRDRMLDTPHARKAGGGGAPAGEDKHSLPRRAVIGP